MAPPSFHCYVAIAKLYESPRMRYLAKEAPEQEECYDPEGENDDVVDNDRCKV